MLRGRLGEAHVSAEPARDGRPVRPLVIQGVSFSQNVQRALGTILQQVSTDPPVYKVELLFSFEGVKRVDVPEERIHAG